MASNITADTPAIPPPPGVLPNFTDGPSQDTAILALEGVFIPLMLLAVIARVYVRIRVVKSWGFEDTSCILAALGSIAHMAVYTQNLRVGLGHHLWDVRAVTLMVPENVRNLGANGITYPWTICFAKLSILLFYLRIFGIKRSIRIAIWIGVVFNVFFYTGYAGVSIGELAVCVGLEQLENPFCIFTGGIMVLIVSLVNFITDVYILVLPIKHVLRLQTSRGRKIALLAVFTSGVLACAASLARLVNFARNAEGHDIFWIQGTNACFTIIEMNIAIIVGCISTLPPFFTRVRSASSSLYRTVRARLLLSRTSKKSRSIDGGKHGNSGTVTRTEDLNLPIMNFSTKQASVDHETQISKTPSLSERSVPV